MVSRSYHCFHSRDLPLTLSLDIETQVDATDAQQEEEKSEKGAKAAENIRYGENISESGMGGMTTEAQGSANQGGMLKSANVQNPIVQELMYAYRRIWWDCKPGGQL